MRKTIFALSMVLGCLESGCSTNSVTTILLIASPTPTNTLAVAPSSTPTPTPSTTAALSPTPSITFTGTFTGTPTITNTPLATSTPTLTNTVGNTYTFTISPPTATYTSTMTPTSTPTITNTPTITSTPTITFTPTPSLTPTPTFTLTSSFTPTSTFTFTYTPTNTFTAVTTPPNIQSTVTCGSPGSAGISVTGAFPLGIGGAFSVMTALTNLPNSYLGLDSISVYLLSASGQAVVGLYASNGSNTAPTTLIAQAQPQAAVNGWNAFPMPATYINGGACWLALMVQNSTQPAYTYAGGGTITTDFESSGWNSGSFPATFFTGTTGNDTPDIYLSYCLANTPTVTNSPTPTFTPTFTNTPTPTPSNTPTATFAPPTPNPSATPGTNWIQATGAAAFSKRELCVSLTYNNQMWIIGGGSPVPSEVWNSSDGVSWTEVGVPISNNLGYYSEYQGVTFNNQMWVVGGWDVSALNQVSYSTDGTYWYRANPNAAFPARYYHGLVNYNNKMWVIGGVDNSGNDLNDVWNSSDGVTWTQVLANTGPVTSATQFHARRALSALVFNGQMYVIGGLFNTSGYPPAIYNDVWSSSDGVTWTQVQSSGAFQPVGFTVPLVYNSQMWLLGGYIGGGNPYNGVWHSADGVNWTWAGYAPWAPRYAACGTVYNSEMWIMTGFDNTNFYNDVWHSP